MADTADVLGDVARGAAAEGVADVAVGTAELGAADVLHAEADAAREAGKEF